VSLPNSRFPFFKCVLELLLHGDQKKKNNKGVKKEVKSQEQQPYRILRYTVFGERSSHEAGFSTAIRGDLRLKSS